MDLPVNLLRQIDDPGLRIDERVMLMCKLSKELEDSGDLEGARAALLGIWQRIGERPRLDNLNRRTVGEVLLTVGRLTGTIGSARQVEGSQELAKDLISESTAAFEDAQEHQKVCEALIDLSLCYWRQGALDEARVTLRQALRRLDDDDVDLRAVALIRSAMVEKSAFQHNEALRVYTEAASLLATSNNHSLRGKFHNGFANVLENLSREENREDYRDRALLEYAAASFHFEQAGHTRYRARVENNLGFLFLTICRFTDAHDHLDRARQLFVSLQDSGSVAQVDDTRARTLIAEGRFKEAEMVSRAAVRALDTGGEQSLLSEALMTHGVALARNHHFVSATAAFNRAREVAEIAGDGENAGRATLALAEELGDLLTPHQLGELYDKADVLHAGTRNLEILGRLNALANRVIRTLGERDEGFDLDPSATEPFFAPKPLGENGFSLKKEVGRYEAALIERALKESNGIVSRAAQMLGFTHYQTLIALLNNRHKELLHVRTPIVPRRRSIIRLRGPRSTSHHRFEKKERPVTILHVEDNGLVAEAVKETLELEGWRVIPCSNGELAMVEVEGEVPLDLLLLDNNVPGVTGVELLKKARELDHRRETPIVMLSATECEDEALDAGADAFLRKPQDISVLVETIARLLDQPVSR